MTGADPRWPCPVCLGVVMEKAAVAGNAALVVDHCPRCGGIWFDRGEVQLLRRRSAEDLWAHVPRRVVAERARCHGCHAHIDRDAEQCPACGWKVGLQCPQCQKALERGRHGDLTLDVCRACQGVWFDHHELIAIWQAGLGQALTARRSHEVGSPGDASWVLLEALAWSPDLVFFGGRAAVHAVAASAEGLANAPETVIAAVDVVGDAAVDVVGDAAGSVFEIVLEIVASIFG